MKPDTGRGNDAAHKDALRGFLSREYGIRANAITPARRGYYGETWRVDAEPRSYFVKLDYSPRHQIAYRNSLAVVDYLHENGAAFVGEIIKAKTGALSANFRSAVLCVFAWIDGENIENDETKRFEYKLLARVYALTKPGFDIPSAAFSNECAAGFYAKWRRLKAQTDEGAWAASAVLDGHADLLKYFATRLGYFAGACQTDISHFYFTHGDAGGNMLTCQGGGHAIPDWDEVMYAPSERDAWVMCPWPWAVRLFNESLRASGVEYTLRPQRLAFYCYHMFFHYLNAFLDGFTKGGIVRELEDYFESWIMERMAYADTIV